MFYYGCPLYIGSLILLPVIAAACWAFLRKRSEKTRLWVVLGLMVINLFQHFFKTFLYPHYADIGVNHLFSAYNMCATLIILAPFAMLSKNSFLKNFVFFTGTVAGFAAIAVPYWFIGEPLSELGWEYFRFYFCHGLLFVSSLMPLLLGLHRPRFRDFWQVSIGFFMGLLIILVNDFLCLSMGLYPGRDVHDFYKLMAASNPCGMMGPKGPGWILDIVKLFSPAFFLGNNPAGLYVPILWYAIPLFLGLNLIACPLFAVIDREGFQAFLSKFKKKS